MRHEINLRQTKSQFKSCLDPFTDNENPLAEFFYIHASLRHLSGQFLQELDFLPVDHRTAYIFQRGSSFQHC